LALLLGGVGTAAAQPAQLEKELAYDTGRPLDVKVVKTEKKPGVTIQDITFASAVPDGKPIEAYVVRPDQGSGPFAGVLFVHWFAPPDPTSNRTQFLGEAEELARRGTVSLLVSTFWSDPARYDARKWQTDYQNSVNQGKDLRRALDVLAAQPGVDAQRIGLVGHDYGAMFGMLVAAVDPRIKAQVLIAGTARFADWYLFGSSTGVPKGDDLKAFKDQLALIDPVETVAKTKIPRFFQYGEKDGYTPRENFLSIYTAAAGTKRIATYPSEHEMRDEIIRIDRDQWLAEQLGLPAAAK
jgi:dienelactone hydrolase